MACLGEPLDCEEMEELFSMSVPPDECGRIDICQFVSHLVHHQRHQAIFIPPVPEPVAVVEDVPVPVVSKKKKR